MVLKHKVHLDMAALQSRGKLSPAVSADWAVREAADSAEAREADAAADAGAAPRADRKEWPRCGARSA